MLGDFKIPSILKRNQIEIILVDLKNRREIQSKNVGRFQKFGGNTNVNRLLFPDGWMDGWLDGWMDGRSVGRSGNFFLTTLRPSGM